MKQKEPPQKYRLGTISNTKLLAGLNRFYMAITSPSAFAKLFSLPLTKVDIHFGHVRMYATPYHISWIIFILGSGPSYKDKLLEFLWVQIASLS